MGDNWRNDHGSTLGDSFAHPDSPAGGSGPGRSRSPVYATPHHSDVPHHDSPAGRLFDWSQLPGIDLYERVQAVMEAIRLAGRYAPAAMLEATGEELHEIVAGIVPGLLICLAALGISTGLGAAGGAAIGALAAVAGALPGAVAGGTAGFEFGLVVLEYLGLGSLAVSIGGSVLEADRIGIEAMKLAWYAVDDPATRRQRVDEAGHKLAFALGVVMRGVLQGVVAFLLAKGTGAAASRVAELTGKLRASKLGNGFANWVERRWPTLTKNPRLQPRAAEAPRAGGGGGASETGGAAEGGGRGKPSAAASKAAAPKPAASKPPAAKPGESAPPAAKPGESAPPEGAGEAPQPSAASPEQPLDKSTSTGHPVDVATGKVFTDKVDLALPGVLGFTWSRVWKSTSTYSGPLGHGWHHGYDAALQQRGTKLHYRHTDGRALTFPVLQAGETHFDAIERLTLLRGSRGYALRTPSQLLYRFETPGQPGELRLTAIEAPSGGRLQLRYDEAGRLREIQDGGDRLVRFTHDAAGRIVTVSVPATQAVMLRYDYDAAGNLTQVTDALGQVARFRYARHLMLQETDRNGLSFYFEYDAQDHTARCLRTWGDGGIYDHKLSYDAERGITTVVNSLGYKMQYEHRNGLVVRTVDALGAVTSIEYDALHRKLSETDPLGQCTRYRYDARGNVVGIVRTDGSELHASYDAQDRLLSVSEGDEERWRFGYDASGRLIERSDALGAITRFVYSGHHLAGVIDPAQQRYELSHDAHGNLIAVQEPGGAVRRWQYDALGRIASAIDPLGNEQLRSYDARGQLTHVKEPDGNLRELAYDGEGNLIHAKDKHRDVRFAYQGMGRMASRSEAGTVVRFEYDREERLCAVFNEHGAAYRFERGPTGEVDAEQRFGGATRKYRRDLLGRLTDLQRAQGFSSRYRYDASNRVREVLHSDGERERYSYRSDGALLAASNGVCELRFERDALGRVVKEWQNEHWVASEYDVRGLRVTVRSSLGANQRIQRGAGGSVDAVDAGGFSARMRRDLAGLELERTMPGGISSRWRRDKLGRTETHEVLQGERALHASSYGWDVDGRLLQQIDSELGLTRYGHDERGQLAWARHSDGSSELRMPDAVANLFRTEARKDRKYGAGGELLEATDRRGRTTRYNYDAEGNLTHKQEPDGRSWRYAWNAAGMLRQVTRPDGTRVQLTYDVLGRRVSKRYRGQATCFVWDGDVLLHEWVTGELEPLTESDAAVEAPLTAAVKQREAELQALLAQGPPRRGSAVEPITWVFEPDSFTPMAKLIGDQCWSIITDHLGTPKLMLDRRGNIAWSAAITTYGELRRLKGERQACPFRWPGQYEDAETGLYYNRHRYYDPETGQYISEDPIGLAGGTALHGYVRDPLGWVDPLGLSGSCGGGDGAATPRPPKGARTEPADLQEQLAMDEARSGAGDVYGGKLGDPKYDADTGNFTKMSHNHEHGDGTSTEVHYDVDRSTGERSGFKIKDDTNKRSRGWLNSPTSGK